MIRIFKTPRFFEKIFFRRTWSFSLHKDAVFLTFDDGPNPAITPQILNFLKQNNLKATFFCVGENINRYPKLFKRIKNEGHVIGNHTSNHSQSFKTKKNAYIRSINEGKEISSSTLFRPPYGRINPLLIKRIANENQIIMWTFLSYDWDKTVSLNKIEKKIKKIEGGNIIVLHDNLKAKERVLPILEMIAKEMKIKGLKSAVINQNML